MTQQRSYTLIVMEPQTCMSQALANVEDNDSAVIKRKRGRPRKDATQDSVKRKRGRPRKDAEYVPVKGKRGRPKREEYLPTKYITRYQSKIASQIKLRLRKIHKKRGDKQFNAEIFDRAKTGAIDQVGERKATRAKQDAPKLGKRKTTGPSQVNYELPAKRKKKLETMEDVSLVKRKRGRPRKKVVQADTKSRKGKRGCANKFPAEPVKRPRGRPRKEHVPGQKIDQAVSQTDSLKANILLKRSKQTKNLEQIRNDRQKKMPRETIPKKRGRPRKITNSLTTCDTDLPQEPTFPRNLYMKEHDDSTIFDSEASEELKFVPMVRDPLSHCDIYYRTLLFVWDRNSWCFRCSMCNACFPLDCDSSLNKRFHRHFTLYHSDRYRCTFCPGLSLYRDDHDLNCHIMYWHPEHFSSEHSVEIPINGEENTSRPNIPGDNIVDQLHVSFSTPNITKSKHVPVIVSSCSPPEPYPGSSSKPNQIQEQFEQYPDSSISTDSEHASCSTIVCNTSVRETNRKDCKSVTQENHGTLSTLCETKTSSKYQCKICDWQCENRKSLQKHTLFHPIKTINLSQSFTCLYPSCRSQLSSKQQLQEHIGQQHSETEFLCKICGKCFPTLGLIQTHSKIHNLNVDSNYVCPYCPKTFTYEFSFKDHLLEIHSEGTPIICPNEECKGIEFFSRYKLKRHFKTVHRENVIINYPDSANKAHPLETRVKLEPDSF